MPISKHGGITRNPLPVPSTRIPAAIVPADESLKFSFKHLDLLSNNKFSLALCADGYLEKFLTRLRDICKGVTISEFRRGTSPSLRAHPITWEETTEKLGFTCLSHQLRALEAWQFEITSNKHGRVHGLLLDNTFYVVWIDPCHKLYN
jgi:hypothetical protein